MPAIDNPAFYFLFKIIFIENKRISACYEKTAQIMTKKSAEMRGKVISRLNNRGPNFLCLLCFLFS